MDEARQQQTTSRQTAGASATQTHAVSRRHVMGAGAGLAAALFAGHCLPDEMGRVVAAPDGSKAFHGNWPYEPPPTGHFNAFVTSGILSSPNIYGDLVTLPMGLYYWGTQTWLPVLASHWAFIKAGAAGEAASPIASPPAAGLGHVAPDADTFQVTLRPGVKWSDGPDVTAEDVAATFWCWRLLSNSVWDYIDEITTVDATTVNFHMSKPATVVERYVIRASPRPASVYGDWAKQVQDLYARGKTADDPEGKQMVDRFTQFHPKAILANGPFTLDPTSISSAQLTLAKNRTGWSPTPVGFDRIVVYNGDITPLVLTKEIDYSTNAFPPATEKQILQSGIRIVRPPTFAGAALLLNFGKLTAAFGDKRARQGLAHAIDRKQNGMIALGGSGVPVQKEAGFSDQLLTQWMDAAAIARLAPYEHDPERAAALLQQAGWTKSGGKWLLPTGAAAKFEISFATEATDYSAAGVDIADQLNAFGFTIIARGMAANQHPTEVRKGNFELAIRNWGSSSNPHPYYSYQTDLLVENVYAQQVGGKGIDFPLVQETASVGKVDLEQLTLQSGAGLDVDQQKVIITKLALAFNELLPILPLWERYANSPTLEGVRVQEWPPDSDPIYKNSQYADGIPTMLMLTGRLVPVV